MRPLVVKTTMKRDVLSAVNTTVISAPYLLLRARCGASRTTWQTESEHTRHVRLTAVSTHAKRKRDRLTLACRRARSALDTAHDTRGEARTGVWPAQLAVSCLRVPSVCAAITPRPCVTCCGTARFISSFHATRGQPRVGASRLPALHPVVARDPLSRVQVPRPRAPPHDLQVSSQKSPRRLAALLAA